MSAAYTVIDLIELENNSLAEIVDSSPPDGDDFYAVYLFQGRYYLSWSDSDEVHPCQMNEAGEWVVLEPERINPSPPGAAAKLLN